MTTEDDLRAAIVRDPDDEILWHAFADWLEEHDAPVAAGFCIRMASTRSYPWCLCDGTGPVRCRPCLQSLLRKT